MKAGTDPGQTTRPGELTYTVFVEVFFFLVGGKEERDNCIQTDHQLQLEIKPVTFLQTQ